MTKKYDSVKKIEKGGEKLSPKDRALVEKGDRIMEKMEAGKISESEARKQVTEIYKKLTTNKRY